MQDPARRQQSTERHLHLARRAHERFGVLATTSMAAGVVAFTLPARATAVVTPVR